MEWQSRIVNLHSLGIGDLNVHDIEKVTVLKDAASTALYGYQGANGVIIIDTKRKNEEHISFSIKTGVQSLHKRYDLMNTKDFLSTLDEAKTRMTPNIRKFYPFYTDSLANTNWQNVLFRDGISNEYQLSGSGSVGNTNFYLSGNYYSQQGIIANSGYKRYSVSANFGKNITKKISVEFNYRGNIQKNSNNLDLYLGNNLIVFGINKSPCLKGTPAIFYRQSRSNDLPAVRTFYNYTNPNSNSLYQHFGDSITTDSLIKSNINTLDALTNSFSLTAKYFVSNNIYFNASSSVSLRDNQYISNTPDNYIKSIEHYILLNQQLNINYSKSINDHEFLFVMGYRNYADNANWNLEFNTKQELY